MPSNGDTTQSMCIACYVANCKLTAGLIRSCHIGSQKNPWTRPGPVPVSSRLASVPGVFPQITMEIRMQYVGRREKQPSWGSSLSYTILGEYGAFDRGPVARDWSTTGRVWTPLSFRGAVALLSVITAAVTFIEQNFMALSWSASSEGRSKFFKDWGLFENAALPKIVQQCLYLTTASQVTESVTSFSSLILRPVANLCNPDLIDQTGELGCWQGVDLQGSYGDGHTKMQCHVKCVVLKHKQQKEALSADALGDESEGPPAFGLHKWSTTYRRGEQTNKTVLRMLSLRWQYRGRLYRLTGSPGIIRVLTAVFSLVCIV